MWKPVEISDEELVSFTEALSKRHGLDLSGYERLSLRRRIASILSKHELNSIADLWIKILRDREFVIAFINDLSVGLTSLFRDPNVWKKIAELLKLLYSNRDITIWHAGCSTGEEVLTMSIVLSEIGMHSRVKSLATDINFTALEVAASVKYPLYVKLEYDKNYAAYSGSSVLCRYYELENNKLVFDSKLVSRVKYESHSLVSLVMPYRFDIIFCRNVMIYFDDGIKIALLNLYYDCLNEGGLFIVGMFDVVNQLIDKNKFELICPNERIYRKR